METLKFSDRAEELGLGCNDRRKRFKELRPIHSLQDIDVEAFRRGYRRVWEVCGILKKESKNK